MDDIIDVLRSFSRAYPEDIFRPLSKEDVAEVQKAFPGYTDRNSAAIGRHCAKFMSEAADEIERLREALRPFAELARHYPTDRRYGNRPTSGILFEVSSSGNTAGYTVEDLHRAASALTAMEKP